MPDMSMIGGAVASLRLAGDIAKGLVSIRDATMLNDKIIELQRVILAAQSDALSAQSDQLSLLQQIGDLEKEIDRLKTWETEKQRYELKRYAPGTSFYTLTESETIGKPIHHICAKCYTNGKASIVQPTGKVMAREPSHFCPECKTEFIVYRNADVTI